MINYCPWSVIFLFPSSSNGNAHQIVNCPVAPSRSSQHKSKAIVPLFHTIPTKNALRALSLLFSALKLKSLNRSTPPNHRPIQRFPQFNWSNRPTLLNFCPIRQTFPQSNRQLVQLQHPCSKFLTVPTKIAKLLLLFPFSFLSG